MVRPTLGITRAHMLELAIQLAEKYGYQHITRHMIAEAAGVVDSTVSLRLGSMTDAKKQVMRAAILRGNLAILAQGLAARDPIALKAPDDLKKKAGTSIAA